MSDAGPFLLKSITCLSENAGLSFSLPAEQIPYLLQALDGVATAGPARTQTHAADITLQ
ncbi:hypothetical protein [Paraburkholderia sp. BCC1886]|uniref:hypothetical protein n=1 Tax=Paraburkholderia sp. BCC1886 TaxID=2562670 RepID=UPI001642A203|nr:hypothetical protein [Paraburkholderia sp. BCC1886]